MQADRVAADWSPGPRLFFFFSKVRPSCVAASLSQGSDRFFGKARKGHVVAN